jgi:hypothetical protein
MSNNTPRNTKSSDEQPRREVGKAVVSPKRKYYFPDYGKVVEATSQEEAVKLVQNDEAPVADEQGNTPLTPAQQAITDESVRAADAAAKEAAKRAKVGADSQPVADQTVVADEQTNTEQPAEEQDNA